MKIAHGDVIFLELDIARKMQARNEVKIVGSMDGEKYVEKLVQLSDSDYLSRKRYEESDKIKVAWIQDYHKNGGAELSNFYVVRVGLNCGFDIVGVTPSNYRLDIVQKSDIVVINNFFEFNQRDENEILAYLYESGKPYVKYEHDHRELGRGLSSRLYNNARFVVFISPLHKDRHSKLQCRSEIIPLAIETGKFVNLGSDRAGNSVFMPSFNKCRGGASKFIQDHPELIYTIIGQIDTVNLKAKINVVPECSIDRMIELYNTHETVLHLPDKPGGGERVVFEAVLCGCKIVCNDNASHSSWPFFKDEPELRKELDAAPYKFWKLVEKCLQPR